MGNTDRCCLYDGTFLLIKYVKHGIKIGLETLNNLTLTGFNKLRKGQGDSRVITSANNVLL